MMEASTSLIVAHWHDLTRTLRHTAKIVQTVLPLRRNSAATGLSSTLSVLITAGLLAPGKLRPTLCRTLRSFIVDRNKIIHCWFIKNESVNSQRTLIRILYTESRFDLLPAHKSSQWTSRRFHLHPVAANQLEPSCVRARMVGSMVISKAFRSALQQTTRIKYWIKIWWVRQQHPNLHQILSSNCILKNSPLSIHQRRS